jgi:hypothetical protein
MLWCAALWCEYSAISLFCCYRPAVVVSAGNKLENLAPVLAFVARSPSLHTLALAGNLTCFGAHEDRYTSPFKVHTASSSTPPAHPPASTDAVSQPATTNAARHHTAHLPSPHPTKNAFTGLYTSTEFIPGSQLPALEEPVTAPPTYTLAVCAVCPSLVWLDELYVPAVRALHALA